MTTSPLHRGEREVSRKAIAQGMSECSPLPCMLVCAKCATFGTRDRGCSAHPAFPAPSIFEGGKRICITRAKSRREIADAYSLARRPGQASTASADPGPIRRGGNYLKKVVDDFARATTPCGYGSLLSQGRRAITTPSPARTARAARWWPARSALRSRRRLRAARSPRRAAREIPATRSSSNW